MKKLIALLLFGNWILFLHAQTSAVDSLKLLLAKEKKDSSRVLLLSKLSFGYRYSKPDTALILAQEGLTLAKEIDFEAGQASCLNAIGNVFLNTGNYPKALELYLQTLKIAESTNDKKRIGAACANIGIVYSIQEDYRQALAYSYKAKQIGESLHDEKRLVSYLLSIGDSYEKLNHLDSARVYTQEGYELALRLNDIDNRGTALNNLGNIYSKMRQRNLAMEYYRLGIEDLKAENDYDVICESTLGMANLFKNAGNADSCLYYAKLSMGIAQQKGFTGRVLKASKYLTDYYQSHQEIDSAFIYQQITIAAKDSLFSQEKTKQLQNLAFNETLRQQEIATEKQKADKERRNTLQLIGMAVFIITFFVFVLILSRKKTKPRIIEICGLVSLLLIFEFISLFIHPFIGEWTNHTPVIMLILLVGLAAMLVPLHHKMERMVKEKLAHKITAVHPPE